MDSIVEHLAQILYQGFPDTKALPTPDRGDRSSVLQGLSWKEARESRRNHFRHQAADLLAGEGADLSNGALIAAYERTTGEPGDLAADALLAEIQRRNLDI